MTILSALWLPILLSGVFVFIFSALIHMVLQSWHRSDYGKVPDEDGVMSALRPFGIPPGDYMLPNCTDGAQMKTPEFQQKIKQGPVIVMTVAPNKMIPMGKCLGLWFLYTVAVSVFAAYVCGHALPVGASCRPIIRFTGITSFLGYAAALWQMSIWYQRSWLTTLKSTIDGALYAAITAATFAWLWPR